MSTRLIRCLSFLAVILLLASLIRIASPSQEKPSSESTVGTVPDLVTNYDDISTPLEVSLRVDPVPLVGESAILTCTVTSYLDAPGTTAHIILPADAVLLSGSLEWSGDLAAGVPVDLAIKVAFTNGGQEELKCNATRIVDEYSAWGDVGVLYLTVGGRESFLGYAPDTPEEMAMATPAEEITGGTGKLVSMMTPVNPDNTSPDTLPMFDTQSIYGAPPAPGNANAYTNPLTISGGFSYLNRNNIETPVWGMIVRIRNGSTGAVLANCYTNSGGNYTCGPFENPGIVGVYAQAVTWVLFPDSPTNNTVTVVNPDLGSSNDWMNAYVITTAVYSFSTASTTGSIPYWRADHWAGERAFWMERDLGDTWRFIDSTGSSDKAGSVTLVWKDGLTSIEGCPSACYQASSVPASDHNHIHVVGNWPLSKNVVMHEYGHRIMREVYGDADYFANSEVCPPPHNMEAAGNDGCAWDEGWATFLAMAVINEPVYYYTSTSDNLETPTWGTSGWSNGNTSIGRVAGALWDIYDTPKDGSDENAFGWAAMWYVYNFYNAHNTSNYYANLVLNYPSSKIPVAMSMYQSTVDERFSFPGAFNKTAPTDGAGGRHTTTTIQWGNPTGETSIAYCFDTINNDTCDSSWVSLGANVTSALITTPSAATTYYWTVRAQNTDAHTWSNGDPTQWWSFTTEGFVGAFNKVSPTSGSTDQPFSLTLDWGTSANADSYGYCYDTTNDYSCSNWVNTGTTSQATISGLTPGVTYYWQARSYNTFNQRDASDTYWSFTTESPPSAFNKSGPANGAADQPTSPTLMWDPASGAMFYEYCYDTTPNNACDGSWVISTGTGTNASLSNLSLGTTYYWQVRAINGVGTTYADGDSAAWWSFTTGNVPSAFSKSNPANGAADQPTSPTLMWEPASGAMFYEYCYDTTPDNACDGSWVSTGTGTNASLSSLSLGTTYYWQVRAINGVGTTYADGNATAWWSFTTIRIFNLFLSLIIR